MTLAEYYNKEKSGKSLRDNLQYVHDRVRNRAMRKVTLEECKTLQDFLNSAFYGSDENSEGYQKAIQNLVAKAYQEKANIAVNNFSMGATQVQYGTTVDTLPTLMQNLHESFKHKEKIYIATIEDRLQRVKDALMKANTLTGAEIEQYKRSLGNLEVILQQLADLKGMAVGAGGSKAYFDLKDKNKDLITLIKKADAQFKALSSVGGVFGPQEYGQVLEWILQAFSGKTNEAAEVIGEQLVEQIVNTAGSSKTKKSAEDFLSVSGIKFNGTNISKAQKAKDDETQQVTISDGTSQFKFDWVGSFSPDHERQGKMDVEFTFNDTSTGAQIPFRISAKNWLTLDRDFGETNVIYALLRSAKNNGAVNYMFAMQDEHNDNNVQFAHMLAKYSLVTDILMGLSQSEKFADTIVINIRSERRVIVGSIVDILDQIWQDLDKFNLPQYPGNTIHQNLMILRNALSNSKKSSEQYRSLAMKYLQTIRVKLHYASIKNAIRTPATNLTRENFSGII